MGTACSPSIQIPFPFYRAIGIPVIALLLLVIVFQIADTGNAVTHSRTVIVVAVGRHVFIYDCWTYFYRLDQGGDCFCRTRISAPKFRIIFIQQLSRINRRGLPGRSYGVNGKGNFRVANAQAIPIVFGFKICQAELHAF